MFYVQSIKIEGKEISDILSLEVIVAKLNHGSKIRIPTVRSLITCSGIPGDCVLSLLLLLTSFVFLPLLFVLQHILFQNHQPFLFLTAGRPTKI